MKKNINLLVIIILLFSGCTGQIKQSIESSTTKALFSIVGGANLKAHREKFVNHNVLADDAGYFTDEELSKQNLYLKSYSNLHSSVITEILHDKEGNIITSSEDKSIKIWNKNFKEKDFLIGEIGDNAIGKVLTIALSPDNKYLVSGGILKNDDFQRTVIRIYNYKNKKLLKTLEFPYGNNIIKLSFSFDSKYLLATFTGYYNELYNVTNDFKIVGDTLKLRANHIRAFINNNKNDVIYAIDNTLLSYNIIDKKPKKIVSKDDVHIKDIAVSNNYIAVAYAGLKKSHVDIYSKKFKKIKTIKTIKPIQRIKFDNNEKYLVLGVDFQKKEKYYSPKVSLYSVKNNFKHYKNINLDILGFNSLGFYNNHLYLGGSMTKRQMKIINIDSKKQKNITRNSLALYNIDIKDNKIVWHATNKFSEYFNTKSSQKNNLIQQPKDPKYYKYDRDTNNISYIKKNYEKPIVGSFDLENFQLKNKLKKETLKNLPLKNNLYSLAIHRQTNKIFNPSVLEVREMGGIAYKIERNDNSGFEHVKFGWYKNFILSSDIHGNIMIYTIRGKKVAKLLGHESKVISLSTHRNKLISLDMDSVIKVWDLSILDSIDNSFDKSQSLKKYQMKFKTLDELEGQFKKIGLNSQKYYSLYNLYNENDVELFYNKQYFGQRIGGSRRHSTGIPKYAYMWVKNDSLKYLKPKLSLKVFKENEWIAWTKEGYFNASPNGHKYIGFHLNRGYDKEAHWVGIDKLYDHFYRPDLVKLALQGEDISKYTKGLTYKDVLKNPPPSIKLVKANKKTVKSTEILHNANSIDLEFNINEVDGGGVGLIRIYQEGKLVQTIGDGKVNRLAANVIEDIEEKKLTKQAQIEQKKYLAKLDETVTKSINGTVNVDELVQQVHSETTENKAGQYKISLPLKAGKNSISIEAFNKTNTVASIREKIIVDAKIKKRKPVVYAIVAGVNEFESTGRLNNLKYSENDAKAIKDILNTKIKEKVVVKYLVGKDLTKANLNKAVKEIKDKAKLEDKVIFYISTHGKAIRGNMYLVPQNNKRAKDWIKFEELFKKVQSINALEQVFIVDACESGKAKDIVASIYDSKASVLAKQSGVHVLLATAKGTFAFEHPNPEVKHGVFTHNILRALDDKKTDKNKDKKISVIELSKVLRNPKYVTKQQVPIIRNVGSDTIVRDF